MNKKQFDELTTSIQQARRFHSDARDEAEPGHGL